MTKIRILKIVLLTSLIFSACMSLATRRTAVIPFAASAAAEPSDDAGNGSEAESVNRHDKNSRRKHSQAGNGSEAERVNHPDKERRREHSQTENLPHAAISVNVDMVSMQVLVTDSNGNVITGLRPENFTIYEDKVKQEITHFSPVEANITVAMLVEFSKRNELFLDDVYNAMYGFVNTLRPGDWTAVAGYDMRTEIFKDFTQNKNEIYEALRQFAIPSWNESNLSDAIIEIIDRTQEIEGKVAVLLISSGLDTFSRHTYDEALNACKNANASVYAIGIGRFIRDYYDALGMISPSTNMDFLMGDNRLKSFADYTGGAAFFPRYSTELPAIFNSISTALRSQYNIGYVSTNTKKDGKFRNVKVDVATGIKDKKGKHIKTKVVTRKGYTAKQF